MQNRSIPLADFSSEFKFADIYFRFHLLPKAEMNVTSTFTFGQFAFTALILNSNSLYPAKYFSNVFSKI